jgi:hypothetical protein
MDSKTQNRYRLLLHMAMVDIRSYCQSRSEPSTDPTEREAQYFRSRVAGAIADWMHDMARQSACNFERFDEGAFWSSFGWVCSRFPDEGLERYRRLFDEGASR